MSAVTFVFMLFLASLACGGLTAASKPGGVPFLSKAYRWLELRVDAGRLSYNIAAPLLLCETCMASVWGSISWWYSGWLLKVHWIELLAWWPYLVLCCATCNHLLWSIIAVCKSYCTYVFDRSAAQQHSQPGRRSTPNG